jgi:hypothetical protein
MEPPISPRAEHDVGVGQSTHRHREHAARQQRTPEWCSRRLVLCR